MLLLFARPLFAQTSTVIWTATNQVWDGVGGAAVNDYEPISASLADFFFRSDTGLGFNIVRVQVFPDNATASTYCTAHPPLGSRPGIVCSALSTTGATILNGELQDLQQAKARGATTFFASSWSPPGSMKSNGSWLSGGTYNGGSANNRALSNILVNYVQLLATQGVPLYAISPQNEPNVSASYESAQWTQAQFDAFNRTFRAALNSAGLQSVQIMYPENGAWNTPSSYGGFVDAIGAGSAGIMAQHGYAGGTNFSAPSQGVFGHHLWMTEDSHNNPTYDGSIANALGWAAKIHQAITVANINAWVWWSLSAMPAQGNDTGDSSLTDLNGNIPKRAYMTGNWSKFVRPGYVRINCTTPVNSNLISCFRDPATGKFTFVSVNPTASATSVTFAMTGFPGPVTTVNPHITSTSQNLADLSPITGIVGNSFTYSVPAKSIVTLTGTSVRYVSQSSTTFGGGSDCLGQSTISVSMK